MKVWRKVPSTIWHLMLVTVLGLPLVMPLGRLTAVPCTHDGHLHIHRIAAMRHAWESGVFFSRWLPDLAYGYGYPFFVYREPTPLYAVLGPHLLGIPLPTASNIFYAFCILAAGWFMFLWVKDISGPRAGIVSSVAYMASPYILLDALVRGNAPESLALPLLPLLLWISRRWIIRGSAVSFLISVFSLAFLSLSHNISTLIFTPVLFLYLLAVGWLHKLHWKKLLVRLLLLFGLGLGMTLFYTGGALLEMDQVTLSQSTTTRNNDFHFNFASWSEILAPVAAEDPNLLNPPLPIRLGWVPAALALIGISTLFWKRKIDREQRWHVIWMGLAAGIFLFMALPGSLPLWEKIPLIDFVQFPWRFIGRAALPIAFLAGAPFAQTLTEGQTATVGSKHLVPKLLLVAAVGLLILEAFPNLYPRYCEENGFPTILDVHRYEHATGLVGVDPEGSYFPRTVQKRPKESPLEADYQSGNTPQRFDMSVLPEGASADVEYGRLTAQVHIDSPMPFTARYLSFSFPGWTVIIDGEQVQIVPDDPEGLITFPVSAGQHTIEIRWQSTLPRTMLSLVSILALLGVVITTVLLVRQAKPTIDDKQQEKGVIPEFWLLLLLGVALLLLKIILVDNGLTPLNNAGTPQVQYPVSLSARGQQLNGYSLQPGKIMSGDTFDIDLAWTTQMATNEAYQSNIWLASPDGLVWSEKETQRPRLYEDAPPTWEREEGSWVWDSREVQVLPGTPPGQYDIVLTLFDLDTLQPLTLEDDNGAVVGPTAVIGQVTVEMPLEQTMVETQYASQETVPGTGLKLEGYNQDRDSAAPGELMLLTLFWERESDPVADSFELQLVGDDGQVVHTWNMSVIAPFVDSLSWEGGHTLRGQYPLRMPASLESGAYQFLLQELLPLGSLSIEAPERTFEQPDVETAVNMTFNDEVLLTGYSILPDPVLKVEFVWQAAREIDQDYHAFVHLLDEEGNIVAQSDGQPANWTRPTTGWTPGEYISDIHEFQLPESARRDNLRLHVGLYEPTTNKRLPVGDSEFVTIPLTD